jgi:hypothetical protein
MKCALCNGNIENKVGPFPFKCKTLGEVFAPGVEYEECQSCGERLLSFEASKYLSEYIKEQEQIALRSLPASDLITAVEAAAILGFSKQNFSKTPKIRRGFIYSVVIGGRKFYSRKSTELYKSTADGRFQLNVTNNPGQTVFVISQPSFSSIERSSYIATSEQGTDDIWCSSGATDNFNNEVYQ